MRLSAGDIDRIKSAVARVAGPGVRTRLFGSRTDDARRGGDIDLLLDFVRPVQHPALLGAQVEAAIIVAIGDRKVDVLLRAPNLAESEVHAAALETGLEL